MESMIFEKFRGYRPEKVTAAFHGQFFRVRDLPFSVKKGERRARGLGKNDLGGAADGDGERQFKPAGDLFRSDGVRPQNAPDRTRRDPGQSGTMPANIS